MDKALEIANETKLNDYAKLGKLFIRKSNIYTTMKEYDKALEFIDKALLEENNV